MHRESNLSTDYTPTSLTRYMSTSEYFNNAGHTGVSYIILNIKEVCLMCRIILHVGDSVTDSIL